MVQPFLESCSPVSTKAPDNHTASEMHTYFHPETCPRILTVAPKLEQLQLIFFNAGCLYSGRHAAMGVEEGQLYATAE